MTRRRTLEHHRHNLGEIRNILNSMKTLAFLETRKLGRFLAAQQAVVQSIETATADLLGCYPETLPESREATPLYLLIGSERGFCGDFNHALLRQLDATLEGSPAGGRVLLLAVGRKLHTLLEEDPRLAGAIAGASVADEVTTLLNQLVYELSRLQARHDVLGVYCLYHGAAEGVEVQKLLPPFQHLLHRQPRFPYPPLLNRPPRQVLVDLVEQYLFAALHETLYTSLLMENNQRVAHLDGAVRHLDEEAANLTRQCNALRQEEIIEEIEVILLSAAGLEETPEADT